MKENEDVFYKSALERVLKERRKMPKEERVKLRQDSVDEIDTTDLENWVLREDFYLLDNTQLYDEADEESDDDQPKDARMINIHDFDETRERIWKENRVDFARMFLNKGEPYTLRKYKKIFKKEMESNPELYDVLDKTGQPKTEIRGVIGEDPRFEQNIPNVDLKDVTLPKDFEA
jgi:hypothetical protein